jgi:hypothetical protein
MLLMRGSASLYEETAMDPTIAELIQKDELIPIIAVAGGLLVGALWIVMATAHAMVVATARERTKREMAAYVAEGTIDADKAIALINAGKKWDGSAGA